MPQDSAGSISAPSVFTLDVRLEAPAAAPRLHFVDGLRGLAMLMVLLYHCWLFGGRWQLAVPLGREHSVDLAQMLSFGHIGVNLFLVLSGFCLYWPFTKAGRPEPTLWEFARKRCRRILPPYYAVLVLCGGAALAQAGREHDPAAAHYALNWLWIHALMAQNLRPGYVLTLNGSLWSLALEFQLYILFPVLVEGFRRNDDDDVRPLRGISQRRTTERIYGGTTQKIVRCEDGRRNPGRLHRCGNGRHRGRGRRPQGDRPQDRSQSQPAGDRGPEKNSDRPQRIAANRHRVKARAIWSRAPVTPR